LYLAGALVATIRCGRSVAEIEWHPWVALFDAMMFWHLMAVIQLSSTTYREETRPRDPFGPLSLHHPAKLLFWRLIFLGDILNAGERHRLKYPYELKV
jgi:hypothetical protein